jgi:hypothetical protein
MVTGYLHFHSLEVFDFAYVTEKGENYFNGDGGYPSIDSGTKPAGGLGKFTDA